MTLELSLQVRKECDCLNQSHAHWVETLLPPAVEGLGRSSMFFTDSMRILEHHESDEFRTKTKTNAKTDVKNKTDTCVRTNSWNAIPAQPVVIVHRFCWKEKHYKHWI